MSASSSSHRRSRTSSGHPVSRFRNGQSPSDHRFRPDMAVAVSGLLILLFSALDMDQDVMAQTIGHSDLLTAATNGSSYRQVRIVFPDLGREVTVLAAGPGLSPPDAGSRSPDMIEPARHRHVASLLSLLQRGQRLSLFGASEGVKKFRLANFSLIATDFGGKSIILLDLVQQSVAGAPGEITQLRLITETMDSADIPGG